MAVLLSYHRLVEKDRRHVSYCWKASILVVLVVAVASSLVISFSFYSLWESFSLNCFMGANLKFVHSNDTGVHAKMPTNRLETEWDFWRTQLVSTDPDERYYISEFGSHWSNPDFCEYLAYTPLFHALLGIIWTTLFVMHGHGGEGTGSIIARPWRIVIPSLVFFTICGISATVCASQLSSGFKIFCQQFDAVHANADCAWMMTYFSLKKPNDLVLPDKNYYLMTVFPWIWVSNYALGAFILLLRVVLVVDFQLVRIVISTIERSSEPEDSRQPQAEVINEATQVSVEDLDGS